MKKIFIIFSLLIITLGVLAYFYNSNNKYDDELLIIYKSEVYHLTINNFDKLKHQHFLTKKGKKMSGVKFFDVLKRFKIDDNFNNAIFNSFDGKSMSYTYEELFQSVLVKYDENKRTYFKIVFPEDKFEQRWLKYIKSVNIK